VSADVLSALVRGLSFLALFQAAGVAIFVARFDDRLSAASRPVRRIGYYSALAAIVLVAVHYGLEAARMAGALSGAFDASLQELVLESPLSTAWVLRTVGLALIAVTIRRPGRFATLAGLLGAMLTLAAFLWVGHTAIDEDRASLRLLLAVHLAVVAFWFGALAPLLVVSAKEPAAAAAAVVEDFSRMALWLVPGILVAGALMTLLLVDRWAVFGEGYGVSLLLKLGAFAALMALASLNKWRYGPALSASRDATAAFQRTVGIEYALICAVLIVTAVMTTFFSPEH
jgi:putative copper resistance protein D